MAINIYVLCTFMEYLIGCDLQSGLIITIEESWLFSRNMQIIEEISEPLKLTSCGGESTIFSFR